MLKGGRIVFNLRAIIVLPVPGGPQNKILWFPAAAISKALLAFCCPLTSFKSSV